MGVERLCDGANFQIHFNADEINLIYQFGEQNKAETCASLSAILPQVKDSDTKQIVSDTLKKLNALSEKTCAELTATTKRRKLTERDHSIKTRLAKAREQAKQPTVAVGKQHRTHSKGKGHVIFWGRTKYLKPIPFRNHMSATASRGRSAQSRGNGQDR